MKPVQRKPKTNTCALKITHAHDMIMFTFRSYWLSAAKRGATLLKVLQPPQKGKHISQILLVNLSLKRHVSFIYHIGHLI